MGRTTIALDLIEAIKLGKADKDEILRSLAEAASGAEALRRGPPAVTVQFHVLRKTTAPKPKQVPASALARGTSAIDTPTPVYDLLATMSMYELTDAARVDVIRFGRQPDQDVQILDVLVSREHGLLIYAGELPLFCDYGTLIDGSHKGSTNGTYIDGRTQIRDTMMRWLPNQTLMIGGQLHDGRRCFGAKITYQLHSIPATN